MTNHIRIPNQASLHILKSFVRANTFFPEDPSEFELHFHPRFVYLQPFSLAMLAAWGNYWRSRGVCIRCAQLTSSGIDYAWRMGLFSELGIEYRPEREEHEEAGRFIPIRRIASSENLKEFLDDVAPLLHRPEHVQAVQYCLSETIRNVLEHAGGEAAYACAQFYNRANRVSIGVADCGVGILSSLRRSHNFSSDAEAIIGALTPGITGAVPGAYGPPDNAGVGLFFTKSIAKASREYFAIISGAAGFRLRRAKQSEQFRLFADPRLDRHDLVDGIPHWRGTVVAVDIGLKRTRSFEATMNAIRRAIAPKRPGSEIEVKVKFT